jgi:hypothetical protein
LTHTSSPKKTANTKTKPPTPQLKKQLKRMEIASRLRAAGVPAEFGFKANPKMGDQLGAALEGGIPLMVLFGEDELASGVVKVKDMAAKTEDVVSLDALVDDIVKRVAALPRGVALRGGGKEGDGGAAAAAAPPAEASASNEAAAQ